MASRFETRLLEGLPIVADGGMGSLLTAAVPRLRSPEEANLRAPEAVVSLHVSFINAGADLIETNTFGANRRKLASHYLEDEFERINSTAVKLAREARDLTGRDVFIGGSIGPLGEAASSEKRRDLFSEQAAVLEERGADVFMIETFFDLEELVDAIAAVRSVSSLPIVAMLTLRRGCGDARGRHRPPGLGAARRPRRRRVRRQSRRRPARGVDRARADAGCRQAPGRAAEHRPREPARRQGHLPARDPRVLRRVRGARARSRRPRDRRLLRHDAGRDRRHPRRDRRGAAGAHPARRGGPRGRGRARRGAAGDRPRHRHSARASSSSRSSSTRRSGARAGASSRSHRSSRARGSFASSTSTTTPRPARGSARSWSPARSSARPAWRRSPT